MSIQNAIDHIYNALRALIVLLIALVHHNGSIKSYKISKI